MKASRPCTDSGTPIALALRNLTLHKLRVLLTILGLIFGVSSVIAMLAIAEGASAEAQRQIAELGRHQRHRPQRQADRRRQPVAAAEQRQLHPQVRPDLQGLRSDRRDHPHGHRRHAAPRVPPEPAARGPGDRGPRRRRQSRLPAAHQPAHGQGPVHQRCRPVLPAPTWW